MDESLEKLARKDEDQYFYDEYLIDLGVKNVAWIDLMGVLDALENEQTGPAVWRGELISVICEHVDLQRVEVFTVGDGVIIMTEADDSEYLNDILRALFNHYLLFNLNRWEGDWSGDIWLQRLIRAGVGAGPVFEIDIEQYAEDFTPSNPLPDDFANTPFGPGLIRAANAEYGPPFSIHKYVGEGEFEQVKWWKEMDVSPDRRVDLMNMLNEYFNWFDSRDEYRYSPYDSNHMIDALRYFEIGEYSVNP